MKADSAYKGPLFQERNRPSELRPAKCGPTTADRGRHLAEPARPLVRWCFTYQGRRMEAVGSAWKRAMRRAEVENFRFHDLRHTWASWHVMAGTGLQELMELGGWKSYEMVLRYAHLAPEHLSAAAARIEREWETVENDSTISLR